MTAFRYRGTMINGETVDEMGMSSPNIVNTINAFGYEFEGKKYTEIPDDAVAHHGWHVDRKGEREYSDILIVDKLRGNNHFEEKVKRENAA